MEKLTYKQAFDKITEAYIKGEIQILNANFCFCGNLCNNTYEWRFHGGFNGACLLPYTYQQYGRMERALFSVFPEIMWSGNGSITLPDNYSFPDFENKLFAGMCAALEVLKQIHKERGENVEDFQFTKRQLKTCI